MAIFNSYVNLPEITRGYIYFHGSNLHYAKVVQSSEVPNVQNHTMAGAAFRPESFFTVRTLRATRRPHKKLLRFLARFNTENMGK